MRALLLCLPVALAACASDEPPAGPTLADAAAPTANDADACDLLQASHVAQAFGVPEASVSVREDMREMVGKGSCPYEAADGRRATLSIVTVEPDAAAAEVYFDNAFRAMTAEESAAASAAMRDAIAGMEERGEVDADIADRAAGSTDGVASMGERMTYQAVEGVGDQASVTLYEGQFSGLQMRLGNAIVGLTADGPDEDTTDDDREPSLALARAVAASQ